MSRNKFCRLNKNKYSISFVKRTFFCFLILSTFMLSACAGQPEAGYSYDASGFFMGIWNGLTVPFSLVGSLVGFCRVTAFPNTGFMYDFGFCIGLMGLWWIIAWIVAIRWEG